MRNSSRCSLYNYNAWNVKCWCKVSTFHSVCLWPLMEACTCSVCMTAFWLQFLLAGRSWTFFTKFLSLNRGCTHTFRNSKIRLWRFVICHIFWQVFCLWRNISSKFNFSLVKMQFVWKSHCVYIIRLDWEILNCLVIYISKQRTSALKRYQQIGFRNFTDEVSTVRTRNDLRFNKNKRWKMFRYLSVNNSTRLYRCVMLFLRLSTAQNLLRYCCPVHVLKTEIFEIILVWN